MSKQHKSKSIPSKQKLPSHTLHYKILPHKLSFIKYHSNYDYPNDFKVEPYLVKNPKWCHLDLRLGQGDAIKEYARLGKARSLRLRSLHLSSYHLDSQAIADLINPYLGELDCLNRASRTLKKLSLSITLNSNADPEEVENVAENRLYEFKNPDKFIKDAYSRLKKFVKDQKYLDEFGLYTGSYGDSEWASQMLTYNEKTLKILTLENLYVKDLFKIRSFPKLEVLRFEHILFDQTEEFFDYSLVIDSLEDILSLPSLKTLVFSQYQRYSLKSYYEDDDEECDVEKTPMIESDSEFAGIKQLPMEFWELLRKKLDKHKDKKLKVIYHKQDEYDEKEAGKKNDNEDDEMEEESEENEEKENKSNNKNKKVQHKRFKKKKNESIINKKMDAFKKTFSRLVPGQTFEYEVRIPSFKDQALAGVRLTMPRSLVENKIFLS